MKLKYLLAVDDETLLCTMENQRTLKQNQPPLHKTTIVSQILSRVEKPGMKDNKSCGSICKRLWKGQDWLIALEAVVVEERLETKRVPQALSILVTSCCLIWGLVTLLAKIVQDEFVTDILFCMNSILWNLY